MALPPGREPIPVPGITSDTNPRLAETSGELAAWIDYLLNPESHDGPRIYRPTAAHGPESGADIELPWRDSFYDSEANRFETVSVLEDHAHDTSVFFKAAQAVSGIRSDVMETAFKKLTQGFLTWSKEGRAHAPKDDGGKGEKPDPPPATKYGELYAVRDNWIGVRKTWTAPEDHLAHDYENDFLDYQLYTENCVYVVAEHVVRYRAILHRAGEDILALMEALVKVCPRASTAPGATDSGGVTLDLWSIVVTGLVVATTTVIGGPVTAAVVLSSAAVEMAGEAMKTMEEKKEEQKKQQLLLEDRMYLRDVVPQYLEQVDKIERDTAEAIRNLGDHLRRELDALREQRKYPVNGVGPAETGAVPHIRDYHLIT